MREEEADRFFGRDAEIAGARREASQASHRRHRRRQRHGQVVARRGRASSRHFAAARLPTSTRSEPDDRVWHVVSMRPRANPEEGLRTGRQRGGGKARPVRRRARQPTQTHCARRSERNRLRAAMRPAADEDRDAAHRRSVRGAFHADAEALQAPFVKLLLALAEGDKDIRILLTVARRLFQPCERRQGRGRRAREGLPADPVRAPDGRQRRCDPAAEAHVGRGPRRRGLKPLRLRRGTGRGGDDALVRKRSSATSPTSPATCRCCRSHCARRGTSIRRGASVLLEAYHLVGGVRGALANEAEKGRRKALARRSGAARIDLRSPRAARRNRRRHATRRGAGRV